MIAASRAASTLPWMRAEAWVEDRFDVVIVGAGLIGSSIAWQLVREGCSSIALIDVDMTGLYSSSELSAGGVRALWSHPTDIDLAQASIEFYETIREEVGFKQRGYLWLHGAETWQLVLGHPRLKDDPKLALQLLDVSDLRDRLPEIDNLEGVVGVTFSPKDGLINANLLKQYYRARAKAGGATLLDHHVVSAIDVSGSGGIELKVACCEFEEEDPEEELEEILTNHTAPAKHQERTLRCSSLINAAGAWSARIAELWEDAPPVRPFRRQVSLAYSRAVSLSRYGMIVFPGSFYCRPEAGHTLCGWRDPDEKEGYQFKYGGQNHFQKDILPRLIERMSGFERTRHMGGWAGLVAETPDGAGVLGRHPTHPNIYDAFGFTGKGVTQSYAVGRCVADLLLHGRYQDIDASPLHRDRFAAAGPDQPHDPDPLLL